MHAEQSARRRGWVPVLFLAVLLGGCASAPETVPPSQGGYLNRPDMAWDPGLVEEGALRAQTFDSKEAASGGASTVPAPSGAVPLSIVRLPISSPAVKLTPTNENLPVGASTVKSGAPFRARRLSPAEPAVSTSLNTTPKPRTVAGVAVPGTTNATAVWVLPIGVKSRGDEKGAKVVV